MVIPSLPDQIQIVEEKAEELANQVGFNDDEKDSLAIAITEMIANAIYHGNKGDPTKRVFLCFHVKSGRMDISIRDEGGGFDPRKIADPLKPENLLKDSGRGIFIVRTLMDEVYFKFQENGTTAVLIKYKK